MSNIGNQNASFHLSTADSLELYAIYCMLLPFFFLMRPLKQRSCPHSVISKALAAFMKEQGKLQPRT